MSKKVEIQLGLSKTVYMVPEPVKFFLMKQAEIFSEMQGLLKERENQLTIAYNKGFEAGKAAKDKHINIPEINIPEIVPPKS